MDSIYIIYFIIIQRESLIPPLSTPFHTMGTAWSTTRMLNKNKKQEQEQEQEPTLTPDGPYEPTPTFAPDGPNLCCPPNPNPNPNPKTRPTIDSLYWNQTREKLKPLHVPHTPSHELISPIPKPSVLPRITCMYVSGDRNTALKWLVEIPIGLVPATDTWMASQPATKQGYFKYPIHCSDPPHEHSLLHRLDVSTLEQILQFCQPIDLAHRRTLLSICVPEASLYNYRNMPNTYIHDKEQWVNVVYYDEPPLEWTTTSLIRYRLQFKTWLEHYIHQRKVQLLQNSQPDSNPSSLTCEYECDTNIIPNTDKN